MTLKKLIRRNGVFASTAIAGFVSFLAVTAVASSTSAQAQALPPGSDPSNISEELRRRQEERFRENSLDDSAGDAITTTQEFEFDPLDDAGVSFELSDVTFDDSAFLNKSDLDAIADKYEGQTVTFADLNALVARVNELYQRKGYLTARAALAPQRIENGVVHVTLIEGRLEEWSVSGASYYPEDFVERRIDLQKGEVIDVRRLEQQLMFFNRVNDAKLTAGLKPGSAFGTTNVDLLLTEPRRTELDLFFDNNGFDSTGDYEGGVIARRHGLLKADDRVGAFFVGAHGSLSGSLSYNAPIGTHGWRAGASYVRGKTKVIDGPFEDLNVKGNSSSITVNTSYPLLYSGGFLLNGILSAQRTNVDTTVDGVAISDTRISQGELGISADYFSSRQLASIQVSGLYANALEKLFDDRRDIAVMRGSAIYARSIARRTRVNLQAQWQIAFDDDLPGTLEFQMGGANSVRGFDPGVSAGDSGYFANLELSRELWSNGRNSIDAFVFFDRGEIYSLFPKQTLSAAGIGANLVRTRRARLSLSAGIPIEEKGILKQGDFRFFMSLNVTAF